VNASIALNLVVLRSASIHRTAKFYSRLGIAFLCHRHGTGPEHLSAELEGAVLEFYPSSGQPVEQVRIGFRVPLLNTVIEAFQDAPDAIISPPRNSKWGRRMIIQDPDGHQIELIESDHQTPR
jgi:lactoylglutathione lyase